MSCKPRSLSKSTYCFPEVKCFNSAHAVSASSANLCTLCGIERLTSGFEFLSEVWVSNCTFTNEVDLTPKHRFEGFFKLEVLQERIRLCISLKINQKIDIALRVKIISQHRSKGIQAKHLVPSAKRFDGALI